MTSRSLRQLEAHFIRLEAGGIWHDVDSIAEADGVMFLCPVCFDDPPVGPIGCHSIVCWRPRIGQEHSPKPGRWELTGTGIDDLTLVAGSSSIKINGACNAHFYVRRGRAEP